MLSIIVSAKLVKPLDTSDTEELRVVLQNDNTANPYVSVTRIIPILKIESATDRSGAEPAPREKYSFHPSEINELSLQQLSELNSPEGVQLIFHLSTGGHPPPAPIDEGNYFINLEMSVSIPATPNRIGVISTVPFRIEDEDDI